MLGFWQQSNDIERVQNVAVKIILCNSLTGRLQTNSRINNANQTHKDVAVLPLDKNT